jgi:hypothetical protein
MNAMLFLIFGFLFASAPQQFGLPYGAKIIETRAITAKSHPHRALILWMINPEKTPREPADEIYTCPEYTRGHYYNGPTRVSLVDLTTNKIINTIKVKSDADEHDHFEVPYKILRGYYRVPGQRKEAKPVILSLTDFNGDGKAHEFVLYDAVNCMTILTALIGYSETQDKVMQYQTVLKTIEDKKPKAETVGWVDHLFQQRPNKRGVWKYSIDYRGRGGSQDQYKIRYNTKLERFEGTLTFQE